MILTPLPLAVLVHQKAPTPSMAVVLEQLITKRGQVTFRSFGGKWDGHETDRDLRFLSRGRVQVIAYGARARAFQGTYTIDAAGKITLALTDTRESWPVLRVQQEGESLLLSPTTKQDRKDNFWPFRSLGVSHVRTKNEKRLTGPAPLPAKRER